MAKPAILTGAAVFVLLLAATAQAEIFPWHRCHMMCDKLDQNVLEEMRNNLTVPDIDATDQRCCFQCVLDFYGSTIWGNGSVELNADAIRFHVLRHVRMVRHLAMVFGVDIDFDAKAFLNDTEKCKEKPEFEGQCTTAIYQWKCLREFVFKDALWIYVNVTYLSINDTSDGSILNNILRHSTWRFLNNGRYFNMYRPLPGFPPPTPPSRIMNFNLGPMWGPARFQPPGPMPLMHPMPPMRGMGPVGPRFPPFQDREPPRYAFGFTDSAPGRYGSTERHYDRDNEVFRTL